MELVLKVWGQRELVQMALVVGAKGDGAERVSADGTGADGFGLPLDLDGLCLLLDLVVGVSLDEVSVEGVGAEELVQMVSVLREWVLKGWRHSLYRQHWC
jgi:hypothetical protein